MSAWMKRSLALLICLVMLCTLVPAFAQAEDIEIIPVEEESGEDIVLIEEPAAAPAAVSNGDGKTTYRALLVGEVNFSWDTANRNKGDVSLLKNMLGQVSGPQGGSYSVTCKYDLSASGLKSAVSSTFGAADDDDVSLFFIATHGVTDVESGIYAGEIVLIGSDGSEEFMTLGELATCLKAVPGKVIVLLGSCGSGAAILSNGGQISYVPDLSGESDELFNEAAIRAFAEADPAANTGELRNAKFYVMTAAAHQESSWGYEGSDPHNIFPYYFAQGAGTGMPADTNGNGTVTMLEMFNYIDSYALSEGPQHTQMYPANSTYALFSKAAKPVITTQPKSVTAAVDATAKFTVKATGATSYQWYYRTSSTGSWAKSTLTGCKTATLSVKATAARSGYQYRCKVSNAAGYVYTSAAKLTVASKPVITAQPENVTAGVDATAKFTVKATGATSYQWYYRTSSTGSWAKSTLTGCKTATLSVKATTARNGYQYRCKVTNAAGYVYSSAAKLTVSGKPVITTQPKSVTKSQDYTATFTVKATGATSYQWYYRTSSTGSWAKSTLTGATTATLSVKATAARSGYQYRCKVSNASGYVYSSTAKLTVNKVTYRAFLIGQDYTTVSSLDNLEGTADVNLMKEALAAVKGARGGSIKVTSIIDASYSGIQNGISTAFSGADSNDVSIFYFSGHGDDRSTDEYAGALCTVETNGSYRLLTMANLAAMLKAVPGKVVVLLDSCGSGAAVYQNGRLVSGGMDMDAFNTAVVNAFAAADEILVDDTGDFRESKFYVLTAASYLTPSQASTIGSVFTLGFQYGLINKMPADTSGDGKASIHEMYVYIDGFAKYLVQEAGFDMQYTQEYPAGSTYAVFAKK